MLLEIVRWMLGYVSFEIIGKFPERFINIVSKNSISIWNTSKRDQSLFACMHVKDYKNIRRLAKKSSVRLKVVSRHGFPFFIKKYHNRIGVVFGVIVFTVIVYVLSCFVWTIDVVGLETISYSKLMNTLNDNGLYVGTYIPSVSFNNISRSTMIEIDDIAWMAINVQGSHASVELKEKRKSPKVPDFNQPANVKAKCDGVILSINTRAGEAYFEKSSAVVKDQMLVSGVLKDKLGGVSVVRADAEIIARTNHKSTFSAEKTYGCYSFSNAKIDRT
ncbi:MAG: sporulation protein YqfD, partial [Ruminococcus sp.]|nr:sporulation protein YqfD [Ruminococcus sp.]